MEDRRQHKRHAFSATTEVVDLVSGARLSTRAADLNKGGCYLDMMSPLPIGSKVRVCIRSDGAELTCTAVVRDSQPGMGMGVAFADLDEAQKALIESWIKRLDSPGLADLSVSPPSENAKPAPPPDQRDALAVKLIDLLHKKGLLSSNDVASLLRDRIL
jgi:PilZ domain